MAIITNLEDEESRVRYPVQSGGLRRLTVLSEDIINNATKEDAGDGSSDGIVQESILSQAAMYSPNEAHRSAITEREQALLRIAQDLKPLLNTSEVELDGNCSLGSVARQMIGEHNHATVKTSTWIHGL